MRLCTNNYARTFGHKCSKTDTHSRLKLPSPWHSQVRQALSEVDGEFPALTVTAGAWLVAKSTRLSGLPEPRTCSLNIPTATHMDPKREYKCCISSLVANKSQLLRGQCW
jgi:hypothetical protein